MYFYHSRAPLCTVEVAYRDISGWNELGVNENIIQLDL